jgi:hypothetical protein
MLTDPVRITATPTYLVSNDKLPNNADKARNFEFFDCNQITINIKLNALVTKKSGSDIAPENIFRKTGEVTIKTHNRIE